MNAQVPFESFEHLITSMPPEVKVSDTERGELTILARSADREAARAQAGEEEHELGQCIGRFLVKLTEVTSRGAPDMAARIVDEVRASLEAADEEAVARFRRDTPERLG